VPSDWKPAPRVRDPEALRRFRLEHYGEPCERCRRTAGVHAHHRIFRSQGGDDVVGNLEWLCGECHDQAHGIRSVWHVT
jgi:hypothetical protein